MSEELRAARPDPRDPFVNLPCCFCYGMTLVKAETLFKREFTCGQCGGVNVVTPQDLMFVIKPRGGPIGWKDYVGCGILLLVMIGIVVVCLLIGIL